jgi:hypothetical protein
MWLCRTPIQPGEPHREGFFYLFVTANICVQSSEGSLMDTVDAELDRLIATRASQDRWPDPDEQEERWKASVRRYNARNQEEMRAAWCEHHQGQAARLRPTDRRSTMTTTDKMQRNAERYRTRIEEIRRDWTRSDEAKRRDLEAAYAEARSTYNQLADKYRSEVRGRVETTRKKAFALPAGGDKNLAALSYRDALDRACGLRDSRELSNLLARAEITGDHALARAVLYRGYELQNELLVHAYFEGYPDELPRWEEFMAAAQENNRLEELGIELSAGVPEPERPQELGGGFALTSQSPTRGEEA